MKFINTLTVLFLVSQSTFAQEALRVTNPTVIRCHLEATRCNEATRPVPFLCDDDHVYWMDFQVTCGGAGHLVELTRLSRGARKALHVTCDEADALWTTSISAQLLSLPRGTDHPTLGRVLTLGSAIFEGQERLKELDALHLLTDIHGVGMNLHCLR